MTMSRPQKFIFDEEFDRRSGASRRQGDQQRMEQAEQEGYARGLADGRHEAEQEAAIRLAVALESLTQQAAGLLARLDAERARLEGECAALAIAFARKFAGDMIGRMPLEPLQHAAFECFGTLAGVPHIAVTVPEEHVDAAKAMLDRAALERGFAGRVIVLGDPDVRAGDFRLEWADGGVTRDGAALDTLIAGALARHTGASTA